jgi:tetratricopeptide (TPR) repeat protein
MIKKYPWLCLLALGVLAQAAPAQDKSLTLLEEYSKLAARVESARTAFRKGNTAKCEREALFCLDRLPAHQEAHFLISQVLYKKGEFDRALEHVQAAEQGYIDWAEAAAAVARQKLKSQTDGGPDLLDEVQEYTDADAAARARGSCQPDRYSKGLQDAKDRLAKEGEENATYLGARSSRVPAPYHFAHGNCLFRLKRLPEAEGEYRLAVKADPGFGETYNNLINLLFMQKRLGEAREWLSQAEAHRAKIHPDLKKAVLETAGR